MEESQFPEPQWQWEDSPRLKDSPQSSQQLLSHVQEDPVQTGGALYVKCRTPWHASDPTALVLGLTGPGSFQLSKGHTSHHSESKH